MADDSARRGALARWAAAHAASVPAGRRADSADTGRPARGLVASLTEDRRWTVPPRPSCLAWGSLPDGAPLLAVAGDPGQSDQSGDLLDPDGDRQYRRFPVAMSGRVSMAWGTVGGVPWLATGGAGVVWLQDPREVQLHRSLISGQRGRDATQPTPVAWAADAGGRPLVITAHGAGGSAPSEDVITIWDPVSGDAAGEIAARGHVRVLAAARGPDGVTRVAAGGWGSAVQVWDLDRRSLLGSSQYPQGRGGIADSGLPFELTPTVYRLTAMTYGQRADGQLLLATANGYDEVVVWTEEDGALAPTALVDSGPVSSLSWASLPGGRMILAGAGEGAVQFWDGWTLEPLEVLPAGSSPSGEFTALAWAPDTDRGLRLATARPDGLVQVWSAALDRATGARTAGRDRAAAHLAGPDHTGSSDRAPRGRLVLPPREVTPEFSAPDGGIAPANSQVVSAVTTADGRTLLAAGASSANVRLWDLTTGHLLREFGRGPTNELYDLAWVLTEDGRCLLATPEAEGTASIWDGDSGTCLRRLSGHGGEVNSVAWMASGDGRLLLATGADDSTARIWDADSGTCLRTIQTDGTFVYAVAWSRTRDGRLCLATSTGQGTDRPSAAQVWDADSGQALESLIGHAEYVGTVGWADISDSTAGLATGSNDGTVRVWDGETWETREVLRNAERSEANSVAWARTRDGRLLLAWASVGEGVRIWDADTGTQVAEVPGSDGIWRTIGWVRDTADNLLLICGESYGAAGPARVWLVEEALAETAAPDGPARLLPAANSRRLLRVGPGGLWPPLGLLADLITLTGAGEPGFTEPGMLCDPTLSALADEPGLERLRALAGARPQWRPDARAAFAVLISRDLAIPGQYAPPDGAGGGELRDALAVALAAQPGGQPGPPPWRVPVAELRTAAAAITGQLVTLLAILGPAACAADPLLPARLAHAAASLPVLSPAELRLLAAAGAGAAASAVGAGTMTWSPGTAGVARHGPLTGLLPTQLALPADLLTTRLAENQLLYRQHRAPAPPAPEPVTIILDTSPPTYGPAGTALRLAAHLITTTLWQHGRSPALVTLSDPGTVSELRDPSDLVRIWAPASLHDPAVTLAAARATAGASGQPAVLCTHVQTARDHHYRPGPQTRLLTAHQPPDKPPPEPSGRWHAHLPPGPSQPRLAAAVGRLLMAGSGDW